MAMHERSETDSVSYLGRTSLWRPTHRDSHELEQVGMDA